MDKYVMLILYALTFWKYSSTIKWTEEHINKIKEAETPQQAGILVNKGLPKVNRYCYQVAAGIALALEDDGYPIKIAMGKNGDETFIHYIYAFKENGLWGCVDNRWFGEEDGYVEPKYENINDLFKECAEKMGHKGVRCFKIIDGNHVSYNKLKRIYRRILKK